MTDKVLRMKLSEFAKFLCDNRIELWDFEENESVGVYDLETILKYADSSEYYVYCVSAENDVLVLYVSTN